MNKMRRVQMLIEPDKHKALSKIAEHENMSVSEIIRNALEIWMEMREEKLEHERRLEALERIRDHRKKLLDNRGGEPLSIAPEIVLNEIREERVDENSAGS